MKMTLQIGKLLIAFAALTGSYVATVSAQEKVLAIKAARIIDGVHLTPLEGGIVIVRGDKIEAVGTAAQIQIPADAKVVDLSSYTLLPGLIDTHDHPTVRADEGGQSGAVDAWMENDGKQMLRAARNMRVSLLTGITTLCSVGENRTNDIVLASAIQSGLVPGPRIIPSGVPIASTGNPAPFRWVDGPDNVRKRVRELVAQGAQFINIYLNDTSPTTTDMTTEEIHAAVDEAHRRGVEITAHVSGRWGTSIRAALEGGVDSLQHPQPISDEMLDLCAKYKTRLSITPTLYTLAFHATGDLWQQLDKHVSGVEEWIGLNRTLMERIIRDDPDLETKDRPLGELNFMPGIKLYQAQLLKAHKRGIPITLGTEGHHGTLQLGVEYLVQAGFTNMEAIQAATRVAAEGIGWGKKVGTLERGKLADMIAVEGNPSVRIRDLDKVRFVMIEGRRYDGLSFR